MRFSGELRDSGACGPERNPKTILLNELDQVAETVDILLIDTGAGLSSMSCILTWGGRSM